VTSFASFTAEDTGANTPPAPVSFVFLCNVDHTFLDYPNQESIFLNRTLVKGSLSPVSDYPLYYL